MNVSPYIQLMRPLQWIKSTFVIAPIFFALAWGDAESWVHILLAAIAFSAAASAVYIANDWVDIEQDKQHPTKHKRPLAAGTARPSIAMLQAAVLVALSGGICLAFLPIHCIGIIGGYLALNLTYSLYFKRFSVIDVVVLACFYVLRVVMGCLAINVAASAWIILATFFLALTIGFAKRNSDLQLTHFAAQKANLQGYNQALIWCLLGICSAASLITYAIYAVEKQTELGNQTLVYSVILVAAGFFRFLKLALVDSEGSEPEKLLLRDRPLLVISAAWFAWTVWSIS